MGDEPRLDDAQIEVETDSKDNRHQKEGGCRKSALGTYGVDWTLSITSGSITSTDTVNHVIALSQDAAGHINLSDGATLNFTELERVTW